MLPALQPIQKAAAPRDILRNPNDTCYMVWNRHVTKKGDKVNSPERGCGRSNRLTRRS
jgi:hypothetical protein